MAAKKTKRKAKTTAQQPKVVEAVTKKATPPMITFDAFRRTSGIRTEHFGGFARYFTLEYGSDVTHWKTVAEWKNAYDKYLKRPVVG